MLTTQEGEAACNDLQNWANRIAQKADQETTAQVYFDGDSNTYIFRLAKQARVLVFRLSVAQVCRPERETECERTLQRKLKDLQNLI
jgi:uncharacterized protein YecE (DUF72 family)